MSTVTAIDAERLKPADFWNWEALGEAAYAAWWSARKIRTHPDEWAALPPISRECWISAAKAVKATIAAASCV